MLKSKISYMLLGAFLMCIGYLLGSNYLEADETAEGTAHFKELIVDNLYAKNIGTSHLHVLDVATIKSLYTEHVSVHEGSDIENSKIVLSAIEGTGIIMLRDRKAENNSEKMPPGSILIRNDKTFGGVIMILDPEGELIDLLGHSKYKNESNNMKHEYH